MWNLKDKVNEQTKFKQTHREGTGGCQRVWCLRDWDRGVKLIFTGGYIGLAVAFKGLSVILRLYSCDFSLTRGEELCIQSFEGNCEADTAPSEHEFDSPGLGERSTGW